MFRDMGFWLRWQLLGLYGGLAGGGHTVEGFMQESVEIFAMFCILVGIARRHVASLPVGLLVPSFKPLC